MSLQAALLALVSFRPRTGYEVRKLFDNTLRHFWSADDSQIYRTLRNCERQGLLTSERIEQGARPAKAVYSITSAGEGELDRWLEGTIEPRVARDPFIVRLFMGHRLSPDGRMKMLLGFRRQVEKELAFVSEVVAETERLLYEFDGRFRWQHYAATYLTAIEERRLRWLDEVIELELARGDGGMSP